ncbi:putative fungistatic metabolite [Naviculisporaceae sp. PSN 640]
MIHLAAAAGGFHAILSCSSLRYVQSYAYGCYTEPSDGKQRALTGASYVNRDSMTVDECEYFCTGSGHRLWGVEYTGECYCGNSLSPGSFPTFPDECNIPCPGNSNETCGGLRRLSLYGTDGIAPKGVASSHPQVYRYTELGCITEGNRVRAFSGASLASEKYMTVERCGHYCINSGFTFFGLEYGSECYCGHGPARSSKKAYQKECNMDCSGKKGEICGGMNRLSAYHWV